MIRQFYIVVLCLISIISVVLVDYISYDRDSFRDSIDNLSMLTKITSPSLSSNWYEARLLCMDRRKNPIYPEMSSIDKMEFVYAK
jgi:hypothetical protein